MNIKRTCTYEPIVRIQVRLIVQFKAEYMTILRCEKVFIKFTFDLDY